MQFQSVVFSEIEVGLRLINTYQLIRSIWPNLTKKMRADESQRDLKKSDSATLTDIYIFLVRPIFTRVYVILSDDFAVVTIINIVRRI